MAGAVVAAAARLKCGAPGLFAPASLLCKVSSTSYQPQCSIVSKSLRDSNYKRPAPFPYEKKQYTFLRALFDDVTPRMDENSKIIVVDGPPTGDKTQFAKELAEELDMLHIPPANLDEYYINGYGFDMRTLNHKLPVACRSFDIWQFLENPYHRDTCSLQLLMLRIRWENYARAIAHVFSTGQGVVMNRSIYSDFVFADTIAKHGFMTKLGHKYYHECRHNGMWEFIRPHLVIYLDIPVDKVIRNVKERGRPYEQNSPFYKPEVLTSLEESYKKQYLKQISEHAEVMIYDWSEGGDSEVVAEDICRIDFNKFTEYDRQMEDWRFKDEWDWKYVRFWFANTYYLQQMRNWLNVPRMYVPELIISAEDQKEYNDVFESSPGNQYLYGFNKQMGDNIYFKNTFGQPSSRGVN